MATYINKYDSAAEYAADVKKTDGSSVSLVEAEVVYDGVNAFTATPETGDAVYYDSNKKVVYVKAGTVNNAQLTAAGYTGIGVVGHRFGDEIIILHKNNTSRKWSDVYRWSVSGWEGDTATCNVTLTHTGAKTFSYTPSGTTDAATWCDEFNAAYVANGGELKNWHAEAQEVNGTVIPVLVYQAYTAHPSTAPTISGTTLAVINGWQYPANSAGLMRKNGRGGGEGAVMNFNRAVAYFSADLDKGTYNPDTNQTITDGAVNNNYPICLPGYLGPYDATTNPGGTKKVTTDRCSALRAYFGEGREGWLKYMSTIMARECSEYGSSNYANQDGKKITYALAGETFRKYTSNSAYTNSPVYTAAQYCANAGFEGVEGFEVGNWFMPSLFEMVPIWAKITYGTSAIGVADVINKTLSAMGGTTISNGSFAWSVVRFSTFNAWSFSGYGGCVNGNGLCNSYLTVPCVRVKI